MMPPIYGCHFTLASGAAPGTDHDFCPFDFRARMETASRAGFKSIGLYHRDLQNVLKRYSLQDMKLIMDDNGITVTEYEWLNDWYYTDDRGKAAEDVLALMLRAAAVLGGRHIKVADFMNQTVPLAAVTEHFARICARARQHDLLVLFEMLPEGFTSFPSLETCLKMTRDAGAKNGGLHLDSWHIVRTHTSVPQLGSLLTTDDVFGVELNDGLLADPADPGDAVINHRLLPGEGEFDLAGIVGALGRLGYKGPYGVEILSAELRKCDLDEAARKVMAATRRFFETIEN